MSEFPAAIRISRTVQVRLTWYNPTTRRVEELRGSLVGEDARNFRLALDEQRTVSVPAQFVVSLEEKSSPQQSALGLAMEAPKRVRVRYWKGDALASAEGELLASDERFIRLAMEQGELLIGTLWAVEVQAIQGGTP